MFDDLRDSRAAIRTVEALGRETMDFAKRAPLPKATAMQFECQECGTRFQSRSMLPECRQCGGSDIDLA